MRKLALCLIAAPALAVFASFAGAQVTQIPNTGCVGAGYPTHSGSARIGQAFTFGFTCYLSSRQAFAVIGAPSNGGVGFYPPLMCNPGPCVFFPAPIGGEYAVFPLQPSSGSWTVNLPNHAALVATRWALQCSCFCT